MRKEDALMEILYIAVWGGILLFHVYCGWRLVEKTGLPGSLVLLAAVPVVNYLFLLYLVFMDWPVHRELEELDRYRNLYGRLPDEGGAGAPGEETLCVECGASLPPLETRCPKCGWSYLQQDDPADGE
jgi:hypothetical protein